MIKIMLNNMIKDTQLITNDELVDNVKEFIRGGKRFSSFGIYVDKEKKHHSIVVKMKRFKRTTAIKSFKEFVDFFQDNVMNFYIQSRSEEYVLTYEFITTDSDLKGFYCRVTFC